MEYLEGEDLHDYLSRERRLSIDETTAILYQALLSLSEAHEKNIIHRDLKPENLFLVNERDNGRIVKILDFGIAKAVDNKFENRTMQRLTEVGMVCGTPEYMAPEQATGEPNLTPAVDIYSIGCIGFQLLAGELPYDGKSPMDIALKHLTEPIPPLPDYLESHPLGRLIKRAMSKQATERFANASDFADAIEAMARKHGHALELSDDGFAVVSGEFLPVEDESATQVRRPSTDGLRHADNMATVARYPANKTQVHAAAHSGEHRAYADAPQRAAFVPTHASGPPSGNLAPPNSGSIKRLPRHGESPMETTVMPMKPGEAGPFGTAVIKTDTELTYAPRRTSEPIAPERNNALIWVFVCLLCVALGTVVGAVIWYTTTGSTNTEGEERTVELSPPSDSASTPPALPEVHIEIRANVQATVLVDKDKDEICTTGLQRLHRRGSRQPHRLHHRQRARRPLHSPHPQGR